MQWQHGSYAVFANGSLTLTPNAVDGRQLLSDPCRKDISEYTRFNTTERFKVNIYSRIHYMVPSLFSISRYAGVLRRHRQVSRYQTPPIDQSRRLQGPSYVYRLRATEDAPCEDIESQPYGKQGQARCSIRHRILSHQQGPIDRPKPVVVAGRFDDISWRSGFLLLISFGRLAFDWC